MLSKCVQVLNAIYVTLMTVQ